MIGDIVEGLEGPMLVTEEYQYSMDSPGVGCVWIMHAPLPGPLTAEQQEHRDHTERLDRRKQEQNEAYEAMKAEMQNLIGGNILLSDRAELVRDWEFQLKDLVDKICDLYRAYCDKWETY